MYIVHLISIDLELSRSFNSPTLHCYSYEPGSHYLLTNQLDRTTCCTTSFKKSLLLSPLQCLELLHLSNERTIDLSRRPYDRPTDELTNQIKSSERQNKVFAKTPIGPCLTCQNPKMTTTSESKINVILNQPSDWIQWFFIVQDTAETNKVWQYIDPSTKKDKLPKLEPPSRPTPRDILPNATSIAKLDASQLTAYN